MEDATKELVERQMPFIEGRDDEFGSTNSAFTLLEKPGDDTILRYMDPRFHDFIEEQVDPLQTD